MDKWDFTNVKMDSSPFNGLSQPYIFLTFSLQDTSYKMTVYDNRDGNWEPIEIQHLNFRICKLCKKTNITIPFSKCICSDEQILNIYNELLKDKNVRVKALIMGLSTNQ